MNRDIVCLVKHSDINEELRYAIRSWVSNLPHRNIVLVGYKPLFLRGAEAKGVYLPTPQIQNSDPATKYYNTTAQMLRACESDAVSDDFYLMNDDFFIMKPVAEVPPYHWATVGDVYQEKKRNATASDRYYMSMMAAVPHTWRSYALHLPLPVNKQKWLECYKMYSRLPHFHANKRTFYGDHADLDSLQHNDVKIYTTLNGDFSKYTYLSTAPTAFAHGAVGEYIRSQFTEKSKYER